jgi:DNA-binding CsgD family transcriptional regulator/tetratricopeptide (TPR) repeat protein
MPPPVDMPTVSPVIVGRAPYLDALDEHLAAAQAGRGQTVLVAGEAGVGKSRLVAEVRARSAARGMGVLVGRCFEPDRVLPYAPLLELLRAHLAEQPGMESTPDVAAIAPELVHLLPHAARFRPELSPAVSPDPAQEQRRLVHAWVRFVAGLATARPLLVVVEDAHWADDASLDALLALARRLPTLPILLVLTYRTDELTPSLRHLLAQLDRERLASELALPRLTSTEVDAMLRAIFAQPQPIRADFLQAIYELTDGNPFYIEEVIRALVAAGDIFRAGGRWERRALAQLRIPRSVQDAVLRHSLHLSPEADRVLRLAAVAGRFFDFAVLAALTGQDEDALLEAVRELIGAQLVVEESAERFAFRHALTRQAIYAGLLTRERRSLHLAIAETIAHLHAANPDPFLADLAYHFAEGEAWEEALAWGERAGNQALALFAPRAAVEHFNRAIDAAACLGTEPSTRLLRARGQALATLGDFDAAQADFQAVLARVRTEGDRRAEWRALLDLGTLWAGLDYTRAGDYFGQALTLARALDTPHILAESLTQLGGWYLNSERPDEAERCLQDALAIFEQTGDRHGVARTVDLLGTVSDIAADIALMRVRYERAAALFRELGDRQALSSTLATMHIPGGSYSFETAALPPHVPAEHTLRQAEESLALARETGWRAGEAYAMGTLALHFAVYGEYGRALAAAADGLAIAREIDHREWTTAWEWIHGMLLADLLAPVRARDHFQRAHDLGQTSGSLHWRHVTAGSLAENLVALGDLAAADAVLTPVAPDLPMRTLGQRRIWTARAKLALARGDAAGALAVVERLIAGAAGRSSEHVIPLLALLQSECLMTLERYEEAAAPLRAVVRIATERSLLPLRWRSDLALGRLAAARSEAADAAAHVRSARAIVEQLAATLPDGALREAFLAQAAALLPSDRGRTARGDGSTLTRREREVAMLVADRLSNRDIAERLSIGERTVETHVGNILAKLEFSSRAEIAAWAAGQGRDRA